MAHGGGARTEYCEVPVLWATLHTYYDLHSGRYLADGLDNGWAPWRFTTTASPPEFTPNELNYSELMLRLRIARWLM